MVDFLRRLTFKTANLPYVFRIVFGCFRLVFESFSAHFGLFSHRFAWFSHLFFRFFGVVAVVFAVVGGIPPRPCRRRHRRRRLAVFMDRQFESTSNQHL